MKKPVSFALLNTIYLYYAQDGSAFLKFAKFQSTVKLRLNEL